MDLDRAFVRTLISGGREAVRKARENGIVPGYLAPEMREVLVFVYEYTDIYGAPPEDGLILGKLGVDISDPIGGDVSAPIEFFVGQVLDRRLHLSLREGLAPAIDFLGKGKPQDALAAAEAAVRASRKEIANGSKVEIMKTMAPQLKEQYLRIKSGERGILFPWETLNEETFGLWPQDLGLFVGRLGKGKCVSADSLMMDPEFGPLYTVEDVVQSDALQTTTTWSRSCGVHVAPIGAKVDTGHKECLEVLLESGRKQVVTPEHPFLTPLCWLRADLLIPGESVGVPAVLPEPQKPLVLNDPHEEAELTAEVLALGGRISDYGVSRAWSACKRLLGFPRRTPLCPGRVSPDRMPERLFRLNRLDLARFLALLWVQKGVTNRSAGIVMRFRHERLVRELQHLMLRLGIVGWVYPTTDHGTSWWTFRVLASERSKFLERLPVWGVFKQRAQSLAASAVSVNDSPILSVSPGLLDRFRDALGYFPSDVLFPNGQVRLSVLREFASHKDAHNMLGWLWNSDLTWDRVVSVRRVGIRKIYDLCIPETECFICNDVLVHNTWIAVNQARYVWRVLGKRVLFATTEMSKVKIAQRIVSVDLHMPYDDLRKGRLDAFVEKRFFEGLDALVVDDSLGLVGGDFDFRPGPFLAAVEQFNPDLVILDGAYLLRVEGATRTERAANAFDELKRQANQTGIPHMVTMQFNRTVKGNKSSNMDSGNIALTDVAGWNADLIYGIFQTDDMKRDKKAGLKPLKVREGVGIDDIEIRWDFDCMDFSEIPKSGSKDSADAFDSGLDSFLQPIGAVDHGPQYAFPSGDTGLSGPGDDECLDF